VKFEKVGVQTFYKSESYSCGWKVPALRHSIEDGENCHDRFRPLCGQFCHFGGLVRVTLSVGEAAA
jgi:hypothetical protein